MPIFNKPIILFSVLKTALISLIVFLVGILRDHEGAQMLILLSTPLVFIFLGYVESSTEKYRIPLSATFASVLLLLNPMFWGVSDGHPPMPNIILVPVVFLMMLILGMVGSLIAKFFKRHSAIDNNQK